MDSLKNIGSRAFSFWGIVLSLILHGIIILLVLFRGFETPENLNEPQSIEGRLVSLSELEKPAVKGISKKEEVKPSQPVEKKSSEETKKIEVKEPPKSVKEPPKVKEEKPKEKEEVKVAQAERKEIVKEEKREAPKKVEVKKEEPPIVEEKPKEKDTVVLNPKEEDKKKQVAEEEKKEQQVAKKPEPTKPTDSESAAPKKVEKESDFEERRTKILQDMKKSLVLKDIQRGVEEKEVAESNSSGNVDTQTYSSKGSGSGAVSRAIVGLYVNRIREEIGSNWGTPPNIPMDGSLKTVVVFRVDENGKVYDVKVEDSSGNSAFDNFCVQAIYKAAPLTPPPPELREEAKTEGVEVPFRNEAT